MIAGVRHFHSPPLHWARDFGHFGGMRRLCDGADDCRRATREQLRAGARVIKPCASGGVTSVIDDPIRQHFTVAEMRAVVETAVLADPSHIIGVWKRGAQVKDLSQA